MNEIAVKLNKTPTDAAKKQWKTFAIQCQEYRGHLYTNIDKTKQHTINCHFPDMTTRTQKEYNERLNQMNATWSTSYNYAEGEDTAKYGAIKYIKEDTLELYK